MKRAVQVQFVSVLLMGLLLVSGLSGSPSASAEGSAPGPVESHSAITSPCPSTVPHCLPPPSPPVACDTSTNALLLADVGDTDVYCNSFSNGVGL